MTAIPNNFNEDEILASDVGGMVLVSDKGTTAPTDVTVDWPVGWESLGLIDDNGIDETYKKNTNEHMAWNVRGVAKRVPASATFEFKFVALQTRAKLMQLFYGSAPSALSTTGQTRVNMLANSDVTELQYGIEYHYTSGEIERVIIPRGVVTDLGDIKNTEKDLKQYEITVGAQISPGVLYLAYRLSNIASLVAA